MAVTEEALAALRTRINQATAARARAEAEHEAAVRERDEAMSALGEFGVSSVADAATLLTTLRSDLEQAVAEVEQALTEAGA